MEDMRIKLGFKDVLIVPKRSTLSSRSAEGKLVKLYNRVPVINTINDILWGLRSACTCVGAHNLDELYINGDFIRVLKQENRIFS